jgi:hypothetical protein
MCIRLFQRGHEEFVTTGNEEKRAENEAAFRNANEHIRATERELAPPLDRVPYLCECDDVGRALDPSREDA